ncbi:MAG: biotin/lipoyl-binding protein [Bacteroidales bacterium]|nr:biotin/lipoyl-binding protein [Bacteroidales bacterium]
MKKFSFQIHGNKYEVEIEEAEGKNLLVQVNGIPYQVVLEKEIYEAKTPKLVQGATIPNTDIANQTKKTSPPSLGGAIKSPLPGVILEVHVKENDNVSMGQKIITIEAMKMENVIYADKSGKVKAIKVKKGDNVLEGDILIELET